MEFSKLKHPWKRLGALVVGFVVGIGATLAAFAGVFLLQQAPWPPPEVRTAEALAQTGVVPWAIYWIGLAVWGALYFATLGTGMFLGTKAYAWLLDRYDLRRWDEGARP